MAVALQWGLETTANGGLSFSRGLIQAATTDNVQPIALIACESAPWVVAFTKWCLGAFPSVFLEDGTPVLDQPGSSVTIVANTLSTVHDKFVITIHHSIGNPEELIAQASTKPWTGMVTIEKYGQWMLQECSLSREKDLHVLQVILPYAAKACSDQFIFYSSSMFVHTWATGLEGEAELRTTPFCGDHSVAKILSRMLNIETTVELKKLAEGCSVNELPSFRSYLNSPENACGCDNCAGGAMKGKCRKESFIDKIAFLICDVLALSLFHCSEDLLVRIDNDRPRASLLYPGDFYDAVRSVFTRAAPLHHEEMPNCHIGSLVDWTLQILGHRAVTARDKVARSDWAMSCFKGQAVYPTIFDTCRITRKGYLALSWVRGVLEFDGEKYEIVKTHAESQESPPSIDCTIPSTSRPLNLTPDYTISWRVGATESALELGLCLDGPSLEIVHSPFNIIQNLGSCLFVERCPHNRDTELQHADPPYFYDSPLSLQVGQRSGIRVVVLDGANDIRFHFLGDKRFAHDGVVVRIDACLKCCLDVCTAASRDILIF
ncbi:uncharacterized protein AUP68_07876 [Ilyonectria robusta]